MCNWYTEMDMIVKSNYEKVIYDVEAEFKSNASVYCEDISIIEKALKIEGSVLLDPKSLAIQTPFGITSLFNCSTGCKAFIILAYIAKHGNKNKCYLVSLVEAGDNVIQELSDTISNSQNIDVYDIHNRYCSGDLKVKYNGSKEINSFKELNITDVFGI